VREVDASRHREQWKWAGMAGTLVAALLCLAWERSALRTHGFEVERLRRELAAEEDLSRRLRLEIETLSAPKRVELKAVRDLHLIQPGEDDAIVITRAPATSAPDLSIVARR
jgi:cell division protein FtsL